MIMKGSSINFWSQRSHYRSFRMRDSNIRFKFIDDIEKTVRYLQVLSMNILQSSRHNSQRITGLGYNEEILEKFT